MFFFTIWKAIIVFLFTLQIPTTPTVMIHTENYTKQSIHEYIITNQSPLFQLLICIFRIHITQVLSI